MGSSIISDSLLGDRSLHAVSMMMMKDMMMIIVMMMIVVMMMMVEMIRMHSLDNIGLCQVGISVLGWDALVGILIEPRLCDT